MVGRVFGSVVVNDVSRVVPHESKYWGGIFYDQITAKEVVDEELHE